MEQLNQVRAMYPNAQIERNEESDPFVAYREAPGEPVILLLPKGLPLKTDSFKDEKPYEFLGFLHACGSYLKAFEQTLKPSAREYNCVSMGLAREDLCGFRVAYVSRPGRD